MSRVMEVSLLQRSENPKPSVVSTRVWSNASTTRSRNSSGVSKMGVVLSGRLGPSSRIRPEGLTARVFEFEDRSPFVRLSAKGFAPDLESTSVGRQDSCFSRCML